MERSAQISACGLFRYSLHREWNPEQGLVVFIGLNPSTADAHLDDPTVRRCSGFAKAWGFGALALVNLFAFRSPSPRALRDAADPVGPENDRWIDSFLSEADSVIAAWGIHGTFRSRDREILDRLPAPQALGVTRDGHPRHPLYLRRDTQPAPFFPLSRA